MGETGKKLNPKNDRFYYHLLKTYDVCNLKMQNLCLLRYLNCFANTKVPKFNIKIQVLENSFSGTVSRIFNSTLE